MNFDTIIRAIGRATAAVIMFFFYMAGKKTGQDQDDLETLKESNAKLTQQMIDEGRINEKYESLKRSIDSFADDKLQPPPPKMPRKARTKRT